MLILSDCTRKTSIFICSLAVLVFFQNVAKHCAGFRKFCLHLFFKPKKSRFYVYAASNKFSINFLFGEILQTNMLRKKNGEQ